MIAALFLALVPIVQEAGSVQLQGPPVLSVDKIAFQQFTPRHTDLIELYETASSMIGRQFFVVERGGKQAAAVSNLSILGEAILVYDEASYAKHVLELLAELDKKAKVLDGSRPQEVVTFEYRPQNVSIRVLIPMLDTFERKIHTRTSDGSAVLVRNLAVSKDGGVLIVRDFPAEVAEIRALLERIDVPDPQVTITCRLIRAGTEPTGSDLPAELVQGLEQLLPERTFRTTAYSMLRAGVRQGRSLSLQLQADDGDYTLSFAPVAYDAEAGSLTVADCTFLHEDTRLFSTDTVFVGGEYTVLGATGREPVFLVVHLAAR